MRNCIVLGAGRSGTSMVAGTLASAGYYMGDTELPITEANPRGFYETREVEWINEILVRTMIVEPTRWELRLRHVMTIPQQPNFQDIEEWLMVHWLALVPVFRVPYSPPEIDEKIAALTAKQPFCFKDPRFSYTFPAWYPHLPDDTVYICVFRHPARTMASIRKELNDAPYLQALNMTDAQILQMWGYVYQHILLKHRRRGTWLFVHYNQLFQPETLQRLAMLTGADINPEFPERALNRSQRSPVPIPPAIRLTYWALCRLAAYRGKAQ